MQLRIVMLEEDDPKKCTAAKLVRLGLARQVRRPHPGAILLDPFALRTLLYMDAGARSLAALDCSWNRAGISYFEGLDGTHRRLPPLLAGNPVNYAKTGRLSTAEALAAALFILGFSAKAEQILGRFGWGHTFYDLNKNLLGEYARAKNESDVITISGQYGLS